MRIITPPCHVYTASIIQVRACTSSRRQWLAARRVLCRYLLFSSPCRFCLGFVNYHATSLPPPPHILSIYSILYESTLDKCTLPYWLFQGFRVVINGPFFWAFLQKFNERVVLLTGLFFFAFLQKFNESANQMRRVLLSCFIRLQRSCI